MTNRMARMSTTTTTAKLINAATWSGQINLALHFLHCSGSQYALEESRFIYLFNVHIRSHRRPNVYNISNAIAVFSLQLCVFKDTPSAFNITLNFNSREAHADEWLRETDHQVNIVNN